MMFTQGTRDNGETFTKLSDDAPEWLKDAVQEAHHGTFPNDWIYQECRAAYEAYHEDYGPHASHWSDYETEYADGRVDPYTRDLMQWAADMCLTDLYSEAEEEAKDLGSDPVSGDISERIAVFQFCAIRLVASVIFQACEENEEEEGA